MKYLILCLVCVICVLALPEERIINGKEAEKGQFPHQVAFYMRMNATAYGRCGGALISDSLVLSAAHCFQHVRNGSLRFGTLFYGKGGQKMDFDRVDVHEEYDIKTKKNDIAIVYLNEKAKVDGVDIAPLKISFEPVGDNELVTVSGFGGINNEQVSPVLRYTKLWTLNGKKCDYDFMDPNTMICMAVGKNGENTCGGDSGSVGTIGEGNNKFIVSIVSIGPKDCFTTYPDVHTRVSAYKEWILERLNAN